MLSDPSIPICSVAASQPATASTGGIFAVTTRSGDKFETRAVNQEEEAQCLSAPDIDCVGAFSMCDVECESHFIVTTPVSGNGVPCNGVPLRSCAPGDGDCPIPNIDCDGAWGTCSSQCIELFTITTVQSGAGMMCEAGEGESRACEPGVGECPPLPVDCSGEWSACGADCGETVWTVLYPAVGAGAACMQANGDTRQCTAGEGDCVAVDCEGEWTLCDVSCNDKAFSITTPAISSGTPCAFTHGQTATCGPGDGDCPIVLPVEEEILDTVVYALIAVLICLCIGAGFALSVTRTNANKRLAEAHAAHAQSTSQTPPGFYVAEPRPDFYGGAVPAMPDASARLEAPEEAHPPTPGHADVHDSFYEDAPESESVSSLEAAVPTPSRAPSLPEGERRLSPRRSVRTAIGSGGASFGGSGVSTEMAQKARQYMMLQRAKSAMSPTRTQRTPPRRGTREETSAADRFRGRMAESQSITAPVSRTQEWVANSSPPRARAAPPSSNANTRATNVARARELMEKNQARRTKSLRAAGSAVRLANGGSVRRSDLLGAPSAPRPEARAASPQDE
eukprot:SAG11_NODE_202_length_12550_cov_5.549835_2_plen_565_part_00